MNNAAQQRPTTLPSDGLVALPPLGGASTLSDQLYEVLEDAIIEGRLRSGQRLNAEDLAQHFGISRIPVRETLRALGANGWIDLRPRHGAFVRNRTAEELADLFEVRLLLEGEAAARAASRRDTEQLRELSRMVQEGRERAAVDDLVGLARLNTEFHTLVVACSNNAVLASVLERLSKRVRFYFSSVAPSRGHDSVEEHGRLVEAIRRRDGDRAARLAQQHVEATWHAVEEVLGGSDHGELRFRS